MGLGRARYGPQAAVRTGRRRARGLTFGRRRLGLAVCRLGPRRLLLLSLGWLGWLGRSGRRLLGLFRLRRGGRGGHGRRSRRLLQLTDFRLGRLRRGGRHSAGGFRLRRRAAAAARLAVGVGC